MRRGQHLAEGVATNLFDVLVPFVTSQRAAFHITHF